MDYKNYSTEDFVLDKKFRLWIENPDKVSNLFWHQFLKDHPEKIEDVKKAMAILQKLKFRHYRLSSEEVKDLWNNIESMKDSFSEIPEADHELPLHPIYVAEHTSKQKSFYQSNYFLPVAASLAGLVLIAGFFWWSMINREQLYTTAYGETMTVELPDGSLATLNANSTLKVPVSWRGDNARQVRLEGEAFFQVEKTGQKDNLAKQQPLTFIVHTGGVAVEVLGTKFNVNTRREKVQVVLNSGKVKVKWKEREMMMKPGELVEVHQEENQVTQKIVKPALYSSWKDDQLLCDATLVSEVANTIEDRFGYEVVVLDKSLDTLKVSGTIPIDNIETFNLVFSKLIKGNVKQQGNKVIINK